MRIVRKTGIAFCLFGLLLMGGCQKGKMGFGMPSILHGGVDPEAARQASEQIPPDNVTGKTYNGGPIMWWDLLTGKR